MMEETIMDDKSLTDKIYAELLDGLKTEQDYTHLRAKYDTNKGPFYNALGRLYHDMWPKVQEFNEVQAKLDAAGLKLDLLNQRIKEAESSLAPLEDRRRVLNEQIDTLETRLAEKGEVMKQVRELEKHGFDAERLRQLQEALSEIGAKNGLKGKEAVDKFFAELKDYDAKTGFEQEIHRLETLIETKKLEAAKWQAEEEALKRKHDDLKEAVGAVYSLRTKGVRVSQIPAWQRILGRFETIEEFDKYLSEYAEVTGILNARKEEAKSYELRLSQLQSQVKTLDKEKARIEAAIDALRVAGIKELKDVAAAETREIRAIGQEIRGQFHKYLAEVDQMADKAFQMGQKLEGLKQEMQRYEKIKDVLESHAVASSEVK
jgi:DNA repair exonuclease SbcCD ATPase subunit